MIDSGVYIGTDFEMVVTQKYVITFRRNIPSDNLEARLFRRMEEAYSCIGICQSAPLETEQHRPPVCWRTAFVYQDEILAVCSRYQKGQEIGVDRPPVYLKEEDEQIKGYIGNPLPLISGSGKIEIRFEDETVYPAALVEKLTEESLRPVLPEFSGSNIGECLRLWNMGIREEFFDYRGNPTFMGVTINTEKHMYIFELTPDSIYCRAARYVATDRGVVFNQNFRQGFEAYMIKDNREAAMPLPVDESLFSAEACVWNSRSVYWSVFDYNEKEIVLHGCQGDVYHWKKPERA